MQVKIKKLSQTAVIPTYAKPGDAGCDLCADFGGESWGFTAIKSGETVAISTGLAFEIPDCYELQIRPRSGLAAKYGVTVLNAPGTIDSGYRGEVKVLLHNTGGNHFTVSRGDRIAQGVICPVVRADFVVVDELSETERGEGGFGHTGM